MSGLQFALALVLFWYLLVGGTKGLSSYGRNVCSETHTYSTYYTTQMSYTSYTNYRTCCSRVIWCLSRCTRYRSRTVYYYTSKLRYATRTTYRCCSGWAQSGSECTAPICSPACRNGKCIRPSTCSCYSGFKGSYCQIDIDECQSSPCDQSCRNLPGSYACSCRRGYRKTYPNQQQNGNCQNVNECASSRRLCTCAVEGRSCKASCIDTIGSYKCRCSAGYQLVRGTICKDLNECEAAKDNCEHDCINSIGSYKCSCWTGYRLANDGQKCEDVDECLQANGGCEQICTNFKGSYLCTCKSGYILAYDKATCTDVNECANTKKCDQKNGICKNTLGSYTCSCKPGYKLQNNHLCIDIDECQGINECDHVCHNNIGSYTCSCRKGYQLAPDTRKCIDVDECKAKTHDCDQNCINRIGSYICRCNPGYRLQDDKKTCRALPCQRPYNPNNGAVNCTGLNYGQSCEYTCNLGFRMVGNNLRTCLLFSKWSGTAARCVPKECKVMLPPLNGILELPCINQYNQSCKFRCNHGFFLTGNETTKCDVDDNGDGVSWKNHNAKCKETKLCKPNPCKHGGKCLLKSMKGFDCDCSGIGYIGKQCQKGSIQISSYPPLMNGKASDWLNITAKPSKELIIIPEAFDGTATFAPKKVVIRHPMTSGLFKIIPKVSGTLQIKYTLSGKNQKNFAPLSDTMVYVQAVDALNHLTRIPNKYFMRNQCHKIKLDVCNNGQEIKLLSSCPWSRKGSKGYQSIVAGETKVPLSLAGIKLPSKSMSSWMYRIKGKLTVSEELNDALKTGHNFCKMKEACKESLYTKTENQFIMQQNLFLRSHLHSLSSVFPKWLRVRMEHGYSGFNVDNIQSMILRSNRIRLLKVCQHFPVNISPSSIYAAQVIFAPLTLQALGMHVETSSTYPTCIATDLCQKTTYVSLPQDKTVDFTPYLRSLGVQHLSVRLHGIAFAANNRIQRKCLTRYGDEDSLCIDAPMWIKMSSNFENEVASISLEAEAFIGTKELNEVAFRRFTTDIKYSYEGFLLADIYFKAAGQQIVFKIRDANATGFGSLGRPVAKKNKNGMHGFTFNVNSKVEIVHGTSVVSFHPVNNGDKHRASGRVLYELHGGEVIGVAKRSLLRKKVRSLRSSLSKYADALLQQLNQTRYNYRVEIAALTNFKENLEEMHNRMTKILKNPSGDYEKIYTLITNVKNLADSGYDIASAVSQVSNSEKHRVRKTSILRTLKLFKLALMKCSEVNAMPESTTVSESFSGLDITYFGKLCFQAICFENMNVSIQDHTCPKDGSKCDSTSLVVSALFSQAQTIANQFNVTKGSMLHAVISKIRYHFDVTIPIKVRLFGTEVSTILRINAEKIYFQITQFNIAEGLNFDIKVVGTKSKNSGWQNVFFGLSGVTSNTSYLPNKLESMANTYISDTAELITSRRANASRRVSQLKSVLANWKSNFSTIQTVLDELTLELAKSQAAYETSVTNLNRTKSTFNSYSVKNRFMNDIQTNLVTLFPLKNCSKSCISIPVCQICQKPVKVDASTLECKLVKKESTTTVARTVQSKCPVTSYRYKTVYTGTCNNGSPEATIIGTATAIGATIGTALGPAGTAVGTVIGAIAGAVIGSFLSLFHSCDETYKAVREEDHIQADCTKIIYESRKIKWEESSCDKKNVEVISGFSTPMECNCSSNECIMVQNFICAHENEIVRRNRSQYVQTQMNEAGSYDGGYDNLQDAEKYVESNYTNFIEAESHYRVAKGKYEKAAAKVKQLELEIKLLQRAMKNFNDNFALEWCLANAARKTIQKPLVVKKVEFQSSARTREELSLKVAVLRSDKEELVTEKNFLLNIGDTAFSLKQGAMSIAKETFCLHKLRMRRSASGSMIMRQNQETDFGQQSTQIQENVTMAERACLMSSMIFSFFKRSFDDLSTNIAAIEMRKIDIKHSWELTQNAQSDKSGTDLNKIARTLKSQLEADNATLTAGRIIEDWIDDMEISTAAYNFTKCSGFEDCVRESLRQIVQLPNLILTSKDKFQQNIEDFEAAFSNVLEANTISSLKLTTAELRQYLRVIQDSSAFCAKPPKVNLDSPEIVERSTGSEVRLRCISPSSLPNVTYSWTRDDIPLLSEDGNVLRLVIDKDKNGAYKCIASNIAGIGTSQETLVVTRNKPQLISQPTDFQYYSTIPKEITPHFACNVTADRPANVSWFFQPFNTNITTQLGFTELVLRIAKPVASDAGFYHCIAENEAGSIESRKARLDVLKSRISNQGFTMTYDLPKSVAGIHDEEAYKDRLATYAQLSTNQYINVSFKDQSEGPVKVFIQVTEKLDTERQLSENSEIDFLRSVSLSRRGLSKSLQNIVVGLKSNCTKEENAAMDESIRITISKNLCLPGYVLHENGFTCVQCPAGTYQQEERCVNCSIGMFQWKEGQTSCLPCNDSYVTNEAGSVNEFQCVPHVLKSADVIFVVDKSWNVRMYDWRRVLTFLEKSIKELNVEKNDVRVGIVSFDSRTMIWFPLHKYSTESLLRRLHDIPYHAGITLTYAALNLVEQDLHVKHQTDRKQIALVMLGGPSSYFGGRNGFFLTRRAAMRLHDDGVHVVAVGVSNKVDSAELKAIASYPKLTNVVQLESFHQLTESSKKILGMAPKDNCSPDVSKDIAIVIEASADVSEDIWNLTKIFTEELLEKLQSPHLKVSISIFHAELQLKRAYKEISFATDIKATVGQLSRNARERSSGYRGVIAKMYNNVLTEKWNSVSRTKIAIFLSKDVLDRRMLTEIRRDYPKEKIHLVGVVMSVDSQRVEENDSLKLEESTQFNMAQVGDIAEIVKEIDSGNSVCNSG